MNIQTKILTLTFIIMLSISSIVVLTVKSVNAQKPYPPSVPQFIVNLVSHPYNVLPTNTSTFDPSTWTETTTITPGYLVENRSIEVTIKNQPFTPYILYTSERNYEIDLYYAVEVKDHFSENWQSLRYSIYSYTYQVQSNSEYTIVSGSADYTDDVQLDFRVQAIIGNRYSATAGSLAGIYLGPVDSMTLSASSDWSGIQTLNITGSSVSYPTPTNITTSISHLPSSTLQTETTLPSNPTITPPTNYNPQIIEFTPKNPLSLITMLIRLIALIIGIITILTVLLILKKRPKTQIAAQ